MVVLLKREQSVNWLGLYTDAVGTSPAEAGRHVTSWTLSALWRAKSPYSADDLFGVIGQ